MPINGSREERGYGYQHRKLRKQLLPYAYGQPCPHCGKPMLPSQQLDLDHADDRAVYRGFAHSSCNRAAGGRKTHIKRGRQLKRRRSRVW